MEGRKEVGLGEGWNEGSQPLKNKIKSSKKEKNKRIEEEVN